MLMSMEIAVINATVNDNWCVVFHSEETCYKNCKYDMLSVITLHSTAMLLAL